MTAKQKELLFGNVARAMRGVPKDIQGRRIGHFAKADPANGEGVAKALGLDMGNGVAAE
jgi:catalase